MTYTDNKTINFVLLCVTRWSHVNVNMTILFLQSAADLNVILCFIEQQFGIFVF